MSVAAPTEVARRLATAYGIGDKIAGQFSLSPTASGWDRAKAAFGVGSLFQKTPEDPVNRLFDPVNFPARQFPPEPSGGLPRKPPVTVENLPPPPGTIARPPPIQDVTTQPLAPPGGASTGIPSEAEFSTFDPTFSEAELSQFGFNQGGLVSMLPRFFGGGEVSGDLFGGGNEVSGWDMGSWADKQMGRDTGSTGDDLGDQARGMASLGWSPPTPPPILKQPKPFPTTYDTLHDVQGYLDKGTHWSQWPDILKQEYKDKYLPYGPQDFGRLEENHPYGIYSENNIGRFPGIDLKEGGFFDEPEEEEELWYMEHGNKPEGTHQIFKEDDDDVMNINPEVIHKDALDYLREKAGQYTLPDMPNVIFGRDPRVAREMRHQYLKSQGLKETYMDGRPTITYIKRKGRSI